MTATTPDRGSGPQCCGSVWGCSGILGDELRDLADPIAAEYRAALGITCVPMLGEALLGATVPTGRHPVRMDWV